MKDDELVWLNGMPVGMLTEEELAVFNKAVKEGRARRDYSGAMGLLGCAKVQVQTSYTGEVT